MDITSVADSHIQQLQRTENYGDVEIMSGEGVSDLDIDYMSVGTCLHFSGIQMTRPTQGLESETRLR